MQGTTARIILGGVYLACLFASGRAEAWNQSYRDTGMICNGTGQTCGHQWIVEQAIGLLESRGWNRFSPAEIEYIKYGTEFADHPWLGMPEDPGGALPSILDSIIKKEDSTLVYVDSKGGPGPVDAMVADGWTRTKANPFFFVRYMAQALLGFAPIINQPVAADNQFHFPNMDYNRGVLMYPEEQAAQFTIVSDWITVSAQKYGAILYQLARAFWPSDPLTPSLARLPKRNQLDTGRATIINGPFDVNIHVRLLSTYLGGNPFLCSNGKPPDLCMEGTPTWPVFVPDAFSLQELQNATPPKSRRAALVYAGWATHMIQDLGTPWHSMNWSGRQHQKFEDRGDRLILDGAVPPDTFSGIAQELAVFNSRADYCKYTANLGTDTFPTGNAPFLEESSEQPVRALFDRARVAAASAVVDSGGNVRDWVHELANVSNDPPDGYVIDALRRSVRDTVMLLSCIDGGVYDGLDGIYAAQIMAVLSNN